MRVVIINPAYPEEVIHGESDLKLIEGMFFKVMRDGDPDKSAAKTMTPAAYVYREDCAKLVQAEFQTMRDEEQRMKSRHYAKMVEVRKLYGAKT